MTTSTSEPIAGSATAEAPSSAAAAVGPIPAIAGCSGVTPFGRGPTGSLFRARQIAHAREVVIRVLDVDPEHEAALRQAAERASAISHPNVVSVHQVAESGGRTCVVMDFLGGGSLADKVRADATGRLSLQESFRILSFAAAGVAHVHASGLVHGALKPANVLLGRQGQVKVSDVGLPLDPGQSADTLDVSTLHYLAPEQVRGEPATPASDVYSLGATLYYTLAGAPPCPGTTVDEVVAAIAEGRVVPLESVRPGLRADVYALVGAMMSLDPAERPQEVAEISRCLAAEVLGELPAVTDAPAPRAKRSSLRNGIWLGSAIVAVLAGVAYVVYERLSRPEEPKATAPVVIDDPKKTEAARRLDALLAREKALGPLCASTLDAYKEVADEYGRLASENTIDDPAVSEAWVHRRDLLRSVASVSREDDVSSMHVERWMGTVIDASNVATAAAAIPDNAEPHDLPAIMSSRVNEITVVEKLLDEEKYTEGLGRMAAWVVAERALAKARKAGEMERVEIQAGVDWLRTAAIGVSMRLRADLTVDGEILRAHLPETTCFGGAHAAFQVPDFDRSVARLGAISRLLMTGPARDRVIRRRASVDRQATAFKASWQLSPAKIDRSAAEAWQTAVATSIQGAYPKLPADQRVGALALLTETGDADRLRAVLEQGPAVKGDGAAEVRADCDALAQFAKQRAVSDKVKRTEGLAGWVIQYATTDASFLLAARPDAGRCLAAHPGLTEGEHQKYLAGWGSDAGAGQIRR